MWKRHLRSRKHSSSSTKSNYRCRSGSHRHRGRCSDVQEPLCRTPRTKGTGRPVQGEEYLGADAYELALNGDSIGYAGFLKVAEEFSGTDAANLAHAYAGICYAHLGKYEEAIKAFESFDGNDQMVSPAMKGAMGNCYASLGQLDKAADMLLKAAKEADNNTLSPIYLQQAGEILVKQGKYDQAIEAYTTIKDKYFRSYQAMQADKFIEQAKLMKK